MRTDEGEEMKGGKEVGLMMTNDWDYDEMPSVCQCQREKNEMGKEEQEGGG